MLLMSMNSWQQEYDLCVELLYDALEMGAKLLIIN